MTGLGAVSAFGFGVQALWKGLSEGQNGFRIITEFETGDMACKVGAAPPPFDPAEYVDRKMAVAMDVYEVMGLMAAREAMTDSGFPLRKEESFRVAVFGGSAVGGKSTAWEEMLRFRDSDAYRVGVFAVPRIEIDMLAGWCAILLGIKGPNCGVNAACATGNYALAMGSAMIRMGQADAVLVVCADKPVMRLGFSAFGSMRALARMDPEDPRNSLRIFDLHRSGTLFGDGAAALLLEPEEGAVRRGAKVYGEVAGVAMTDDAYHLAAPDPEGTSIVYAMRQAIEGAGLAPSEIEYINAHGTGTPQNDVMETRGIKKVFGHHAYQVPVSSIKSMVGHQLGAASATEAIASLLTIRDGIVPPTINLKTPDPECDLDYVPNAPRRKSVRTVLSNSFGFGGHNACVVFREYR